MKAIYIFTVIIFLLSILPQTLAQERNALRSRHRNAYVNRPDSLPEGTIEIKNIVYKITAADSLKLDIYLPQKHTKKTPLIVWIHGGAWMRGDKEVFRKKNNRLLNALLNEGYAIASINYRLSGEAIFPAQIQDCNDAINYLWINNKKYSINKNRIAVMGRSAGGHLAALVATSNNHAVPDFFSAPNKPKFKINALISFFGPTELIALEENKKKKSDKSSTARFLGGQPSNIPEIARKASPVTYINKHTPPTILLHGTSDKKVPATQSELFKSKLDENDVANEIYLVEEATHGDRIFDSEQYVTFVLNFLRTHFGIRK